MLDRIRLLHGALYFVRGIGERVNQTVGKWSSSINERIDDINSQQVVFFTRGDDIANLNLAMEYVRDNEHTNKVKIVTVVPNETEVPENLAHELDFLDRAYPEIDVVHDNYLHGEMVAMGTMAQLVMEQSGDAERVARFFARVGLPVHLEQVSLSVQHSAELDTLIEATLERPIAHNMPMPVTHDSVREAILAAHELGLGVAADVGDAAYRRLHC